MTAGSLRDLKMPLHVAIRRKKEVKREAIPAVEAISIQIEFFERNRLALIRPRPGHVGWWNNVAERAEELPRIFRDIIVVPIQPKREAADLHASPTAYRRGGHFFVRRAVGRYVRAPAQESSTCIDVRIVHRAVSQAVAGHQRPTWRRYVLRGDELFQSS